MREAHRRVRKKMTPWRTVSRVGNGASSLVVGIPTEHILSLDMEGGDRLAWRADKGLIVATPVWDVREVDRTAVSVLREDLRIRRDWTYGRGYRAVIPRAIACAAAIKPRAQVYWQRLNGAIVGRVYRTRCVLSETDKNEALEAGEKLLGLTRRGFSAILTGKLNQMERGRRSK